MDLIKIPGLKKPVPTEAIVCIRGYGNYAVLRFEDGQEYTAVETLKWFEERLPSFVRLHRHWLINPSFFSRFEQQTPKQAQVTLRDGTSFTVARRRIKAVQIRVRLEFAN